MPSFTAFSNTFRDPEIEYFSQAVQVTIDDTMAEFKFKDPDLIINEPDTTKIYWVIEKADTETGPFTHSVGGSFAGRNGAPYPPGKPNYEPTIRTNIDQLRGKWVRGKLWFFKEDGKRLRFRIDGRTYTP